MTTKIANRTVIVAALPVAAKPAPLRVQRSEAPDRIVHPSQPVPRIHAAPSAAAGRVCVARYTGRTSIVSETAK
jgi:hypothetical protein